MRIPSNLVIKRPLTLWEELCVWVGLLGMLACIVYGNWIMVIVFACATFVSYNNIQNDCIKIDVKPINVGEKDLYKIVDYVDGEKRETYLIAESFDEDYLFCHVEDLKPGEIMVLGKANFFK